MQQPNQNTQLQSSSVILDVINVYSQEAKGRKASNDGNQPQGKHLMLLTVQAYVSFVCHLHILVGTDAESLII